MELRDLIAVFQKQINFFLLVVMVFVVTAWVWQQHQPPRFQAILLINIGRAGVSETTDYTYDSFYRLQADERFADTVVRWLSTPRVVEDIYHEAHLDPKFLGLSDLTGVFSAGRLSSQMISVKYESANSKILDQLAKATVVVLNRYTDTLNTEGREKSWFVVIGSDPVIRESHMSLNLALLAGLALGAFFGFWLVLFRHYFSENTKQITENS